MSSGAWHPDPTGRHQLRWWDGYEWTSTVHDDGVTTDELATAAAPPTTCASCGGSTTPGDVFCGSCGAALTTATAAAGPETAAGPPGSPPPPTRPPAPPPPITGNAPTDVVPPVIAPATAGSSMPPMPAILGGVAAALTLLVLLVLVFVGRGSDEDVIGPATTSPPATAPPVTQPPVTQPPVTQPPVTEPPVPTQDFQEVVGRIDESTGSFLAIDVELAAGDALRFRVEPGTDLDTELLVLVDQATGFRFLEVVWPAIPPDMRPDDIGEFFEMIREESRSELNLGEARSTFDGMIVIDGSDVGFEGEFDAGFLVAVTPGRYTVLAQAWWGTGDARLIVEVSPGRIDLARDLDRYLDDPWLFAEDDAWLDEFAFFHDPAPYRP